jgi:hypothetical protein
MWGASSRRTFQKSMDFMKKRGGGNFAWKTMKKDFSQWTKPLYHVLGQKSFNSALPPYKKKRQNKIL